MKRAHLIILALTLLGCAAFMACGTVSPPEADDLVDPGATQPANDDTVPDDGATGNPATDNPPGGDNSGDAPDGGTGSPTDSPTSGNGTDPADPQRDAGITARLRNESGYRADVTLRFIKDELVNHLAFVRVLPDTVTTIVSPDLADLLELSGVDERALALPSKRLSYGIDFDENTPAEYVIPPDVSDDGSQGEPGEITPPTIEMLEPAEDSIKLLGSTLFVRWTDSSDVPGALVRLWLRAVGADAGTGDVPVGPAVGAALDGLNDELTVVLEGIEPGTYEVVGEIDDGITVETSVAPGLIRVEIDQGNKAPTILISSPSRLTELRNGDSLRITWQDEDEDDNATITFSLAVADPAVVGIGPYVISPPLAEDPDGDYADSVTVTITGVLPGTYDLVGEISDGNLVGTARVEAAIHVLPEAANDPPHLVLIEPALDFEMNPGESFVVRWTDSDENDNASISLLLDPDLQAGALDGNEVLIVSSLSEDEDGPGDQITIGVPLGVPKGKYRLTGSIKDGLTEVITWAPGIIYFGVSAATEPGEEPPPPSLALLEPSVSQRVRMGDTIEVWLEAENIPPGADIRFALSNVPFGGNVTADVTPETLLVNQAVSLALPTSVDLIANNAWPRQFTLTAEVVVDDMTYRTVAPASVWVRQDVELVSVEMVNYTCDSGQEPAGDEREFTGLEIKWFGGGFEEREIHSQVDFWVSNDGTIPADDDGDTRHWIIHQALESPNKVRTERVLIFRVVDHVLTDDILDIGLMRGDYQIMTAVEPAVFGRIVSGPYPEWIQVCLRGTGD